MKMIILGSGTGVPSLQRNSAGYSLMVRHHQYLIDCGSGTIKQLLKTGIDPLALDALFITHTHPDHIGDLIPLLHALKLPVVKRTKPFLIFGPKGFAHFFKNQIIPVLHSLPKHFPVDVQEAAESQELEDMRVQTIPTVHSSYLNSVAYRFEAQGLVVVFSGDCDADPGIIQISKDADLMVIDCSTLAVNKVKGHLSAEECGQIAHQASVKRLLLSHLYPISGPDQLRLEECQKHFAGDVQLAEDLLEVLL